MDWIAAGIGGFALGALVGWLAARSRSGAADELRRQGEALQARLDELQARLGEAGALRAAAEARLKDLQDLQGSFKTLAGEALLNAQQRFLDLASQKLVDREKAIEAVVAPLQLSLGKVEKGLVELGTQRAEIKQQVEGLVGAQGQLQRETGRLAEALKNSAARGRWGEIQLRRVLELAGMSEYCDFDTQASVATEEGRLRPDVVIRMPGGKTLVIDAKAPIEAYLEALAAKTEEDRQRLLKKHAQDVRTQVYSLSKKQYWDQFERSPEFVVLFLPGEPFFAAALEADPSLLEEAVAKKVVLATPTTLVAMLKAVHYSWQQEKMAENAQRISDAGRELHDRVATVLEHAGTLGKSLGAAVEAYNRTVGSLETRVLPQARKLRELGAAGAKDLAEPARVEKSPRAPEPADSPGK